MIWESVQDVLRLLQQEDRVRPQLSRLVMLEAGPGTPDRIASRNLVSSSVSGVAVKATMFAYLVNGDVKIELLALGVWLIGGPMDIDDIKQRIAFITDNLGNIIELMEPGTWAAGRPD